MKTITVHPLVLQFDADQITHGSSKQQTQQAIDLINLVLQREPYGLGAQLFLSKEFEVKCAKTNLAA